jgi:hypothetical protein
MDPTQELSSPAETDFEEMAPTEPALPIEESNPVLFHETREGRLLSQLIDDLERPEYSIRQQMVMVWRKMENYWRDRQYIIWDEVAGDWRTPEELRQMDNKIEIDPASYAKIINIYKAHGEAIISALSSGLPYVRFFPDDADVPEDLFTAKSYSKISELIQKRNKGQLLFIRALFVLYNCGTVFAYNENKDTTQFGTHKKKQYEDKPIINRQHFCPSCGMMMGSDQLDAPEPTDAVPGSVQSANTLPPPQPMQCPQCGEMVQPDTEDFEDIIPQLIGETEEPKSHEFIEIFSGQHVKAAHWARTQAQLPYLTLETEEHYALLRDIYPEIADKIIPTTASETFDAQSRTNADYRGDTPRDLTTFKRSWIRPWAYNVLLKTNPSTQGSGMEGEELDDASYLKKLYPEGVYIAKVGEIIAEAVPDKLDDHWTVTMNPLSNFLHADPLAQPLVPVQDITNELTNLTLETIEFGIPETFYDSETIDADQYGKSEARPGMLYPAKARPTMGLDSSFHTVKTSALSQEVDNFANRITDAGQLVVGAQPTIWGGALEGAGGTAREVEQSKASALQRLNLTWTMLKIWWADVMAKSVRSFAVNMKDDEKYVEAKGNSFINVWIRRAEMTGKVGSIEPDVNEAFPISWAQKRDILMNMIALKNPMVESVLAHPENAGTIASVIGFPELYIPGDDARNKQLYEISQLVMAQPMVMPPPMPVQGVEGEAGPPMNGPGEGEPPMQEQFQSTIPVEEWNDHPVESETCKAWLMSDVGIDTKEKNPAGYMNVVTHMQEHDKFIQQAQAAEMAAQAPVNDAKDQGEKSNG